MFTDIVKSTPLLEAIGDEAWSALIEWHDSTLRSMFRSYSGREIDHAGDGFFVVFPDIVAALDCSIAVQRTLAEHRRRHGFAPRLRIALHTAPITRQGNAVQGRGVHEAARIAAAAGTDEILVSAQSLAAFNGRYVRLEPRQIEAAGFAEPISVVPIRWQMGSAPADE
jgi:class 3 adenylate cyclase